MSYSAKVLLDSISPIGNRLITFEIQMPRIVLAEFNTHRCVVRSVASSRAIPFKKRLDQVLEDPFIPNYWGKNQKGMQADTEISTDDKERAEHLWKTAFGKMIKVAKELDNLGIHKQITNRLLEPFSFVTVITSGTDWDNFFKLRSSRWSKDAQPELRQVADMMLEVYESNQPKLLEFEEWHLPLIQDDERNISIGDLIKISVSRCARISYLNHNGIRAIEDDISLYERLVDSKHFSPTEHVAQSFYTSQYFGCFKGWLQHRQQMEGNVKRIL